MAIQALCRKADLKEAVRDLLSYQRRPKEVRIVCPIISNPEICDGNTFLKMVERLSRVEDITISLITRKPIVRSRASDDEKREASMRREIIQRLEDLNIKVFQWPSRELHAKIILTESSHDKLALVTSACLLYTSDAADDREV